MLTFRPYIYRGLNFSAAYPQSLSFVPISLPLYKDKGAMKEDRQRALEPSFTYVCECCVFKHNICVDQVEVPDYTLDSPNFLSLECVAGLRCPPVRVSFEEAVVGEHRREVAKESGRGAPLGDLNEHPQCGRTFSSSFFRSGPYMVALLLPFFP